MPTVFVSDALAADRLAFSPPPRPMGGWADLSAYYQASFAACGLRVQPVLRPEIYQAPQALQVLGAAPGDLHLAVKPIEHLRPFHGLANLFVCDWPFAELSGTALGGSPLFDQRHMLRQADAVLCCTSFTAEVLRQAGLPGVVTLPPYVPRKTSPHPAARDGHHFLCVVDDSPLARQLGPTLEGFARAAASRGGLSLTICLQGGADAHAAALRDRLRHIGGAEGIAVVRDPDGGLDLDERLAGADFLLCGHAAPGLYLPLARAMLAGVPLVTTITAGTASYLPRDGAVQIATRAARLDDDDGEAIGRPMPLMVHAPTGETVRDAVLAAAALDQPARQRMAAVAQAAAERQFGLAAFLDGWTRLKPLLPGGTQ